jgi:hypothetical protein
MRFVAIVALLFVLAGCAGTQLGAPSAAVAGSTAGIEGDERGGRIPDGVANSKNAYGAATAFCKNYGKKAFITKWDSPSDRGAIVFECK